METVLRAKFHELVLARRPYAEIDLVLDLYNDYKEEVTRWLT